MPTYTYKCYTLDCQHVFETNQKITDDPLTLCPKCHKHNLERVITGGTGFILKGGGWFKTDYKDFDSRDVEEAEKQLDELNQEKT